MNPDTPTKFDRWFVAPLNTLRTIPNGDGAFVALSIGFQLCERYFRAQTHTQDDHSDMSFKDAAANDLGVDPNLFKRFWSAFRNGLQHQGTPKKFVDNQINYKWEISDAFTALPQQKVVDATTAVIQLDPWKFADSMVDKFLNNPAILDDAMNHAFGDIYTA